MILRSDVLPEPEGPMIAVIYPALNIPLTPFKIFLLVVSPLPQEFDE
jgi:hypothetical protein